MHPWRNDFDRDYLAAMIQLGRKTVVVLIPHVPKKSLTQFVPVPMYELSLNGVRLGDAIRAEREDHERRLGGYYAKS